MTKSTPQTAVIFGGSSGIGFATASLLAKDGKNVIIVGKNAQKLALARQKLMKISKNIDSFKCDISSREQVETVARLIGEKYKQIDFLVNSAGISITQKKGELAHKTFTDLIKVNLTGTYVTSMIFGYGILADGGSIVNVSSVRGRTGTDSYSAGYAAAKAGVINFTKTFALEMSEKNIRVNCVAPGLTYPTDISADWTEEFRLRMANMIPLKRLGSPEDIAQAIVFLISPLSSYITGQTLDVNGGLWMN